MTSSRTGGSKEGISLFTLLTRDYIRGSPVELQPAAVFMQERELI
jgi:hypothetical protein